MTSGAHCKRQSTGAGFGKVTGDGRTDLAFGSGTGNAGGAILYYGSSDGSLVAGPVDPGLGANTAALAPVPGQAWRAPLYLCPHRRTDHLAVV